MHIAYERQNTCLIFTVSDTVRYHVNCKGTDCMRCSHPQGDTLEEVSVSKKVRIHNAGELPHK